MKITCQSCGSKYTVSDEKVQGKTVKIKCRKCSATILVNSSGAVQQNGAVADSASHGAGGGGDGAGPYTVNVAEGDQRTMTLAEIVEAYNTSVITAETYVWADGMADWQPLGQVDAIVAALHAAASSHPPPAAAPQAAPAAVPTAVAPAIPAPATSLGNQLPSEPLPAAAAAPRTAARREPRPARDLFGGGLAQQTQPADDVATSAPLFSAAASAPAQSPQPGARDENSVLFSLSALTAKAGAAPISPGRTTATKDDSGLIDLRALSAGAAQPAPSNLVPDNAALFPLGLPPTPSAPAPGLGAPAEAAAPKSRNGLFMGIGGLVAGAAIVGAFLLMKGGEDKPTPQPTTEQTAAAPATAAPAGTVAPTAEPSAAPTAEASAAPTASASATAVAAAPKPAFKPGGLAKPPGASKPGGSPPPPAPAAAKPAGKGNCGCPHDDLMCAMKCSTK